jgi:cytochrome c oxidase subunit 2
MNARGMGRRRWMAMTGVGLAATGAAVGRILAQPAERVIPIETIKFVFRPAHIELKRGEPVVFELTARDVFMGFSLPDFNVRTDVVPGKTSRLRLVPDKPGTFTFLCDIFCGDGHEQMNGTLVVA